MWTPKSKNRDKPYRVKKTGIKDENIDRQILVLHQAIAAKLLAEPALLEQVKTKLEERRDNGQLGYGAYLHWQSVLELYSQPKEFCAGITEDSPYLRKLRRRTPFVGILTEQERQLALSQHSLGTLAQVLTGF
ncbi:hypothetical protein [Rheinheimera soli]|uniref:Uncharacterized protein n=1 Tax=Rheinheimera soli TaxID=443616 RepID=A0ABU1W4J7_9GAMM|nr:hypothetical protein [Rheinheimera soli]MDR7122876.1 hypothetical protein [Rheinheimera soli]